VFKICLLKKEKFVTPNNAEGLKVFGTADFPSLVEGKTERGQYIVLVFNAENVVQQIVITWREGDDYASDIVDRIINSVELKKEEN